MMANSIMWRADAEKYLSENGWKLFLDKIIKEKLIIMEPEVKTLTRVDLTEYGTIKVEEWPEGLVLWVGGVIRWKEWGIK